MQIVTSPRYSDIQWVYRRIGLQRLYYYYLLSRSIFNERRLFNVVRLNIILYRQRQLRDTEVETETDV